MTEVTVTLTPEEARAIGRGAAFFRETLGNLLGRDEFCDHLHPLDTGCQKLELALILEGEEA